MKKILLSAAAIFAAMSMNAQTVVTINPDNALELADDGSALTAGTVLYEGEEGTLTIGADDTYKKQGIKANAAGTDINGGLQGGSNPKDADGGTCASTLKAPVSGAFFTYKAKADGYLYVIHKASSNKAYTVFEEGAAVGYTFAAIAGDGSSILGAKYKFTLKGEGEYNNLVNPVEWAEQEYLKVADPEAYEANFTVADDGTKSWNKIGMNGVGVIVFPVYADCTYNFNANGSKMSLAGLAFSTEDNVVVKDGDVVVYDPTGSEPEPGGEEKTLDIDLTAATWGWGWSCDTSNDEAGNLVGVLTGGWGAVSTGYDPAADWSAYKTLVCVIESIESAEAEPYIQILAKGDADEKKAAYTAISETFTTQKTFEIPLDPAFSNSVKQLWFQGKGVGDKIVVSKVYLTTKEATSAISSAKIAQAEGAIYNLAGQKVDASYSGIVIKGGKKFLQK